MKIRDKQITQRRLISSVGSLLAKKGFKGIGVNAVAREAGVDKVLIYRYFGGLQGLIAAFGKEGDFWPGPLELAGGDLRKFSQLPLEEKLTIFGSAFVKALRKRPMTQAIMAWEIIEPNDLTEDLERIREQSIMEFFQMFFLADDATNKKVQFLLPVLGAAITYLVLRSKHIDLYGGLDIGSEEGWAELESGLHRVIKQVLRSV